MKKILVLFALTAIAMVSVNAQDNLKWGVMAGMNVSKYTFTGFDNRVGFHLQHIYNQHAPVSPNNTD